MRIIKKLVSAVTALSVFACSGSFCYADEVSANQALFFISEEEIQEEFNKLIYSFAVESDSIQFYDISGMAMYSDSDIDFPDNYAGACYCADGNAALDIYLTDDNKDAFLDVLDENIAKFHEVDFSLEELLSAQELISSYMEEYNIRSAAIIQKENTIQINGYENFSETDFYELLVELNIDSDIVTIESESSPITTTASKRTAPAGSRISTYNNSGGYATIGFNAYNRSSGQYGVITAGHFFEGLRVETMIMSNGDVINSKYYATISYDNNSDCDAGFLPFCNDTWSAVNAFGCDHDFGFINSIKYPAAALEGTSVVKYGDTTGKQEGQLVSSYINIFFDNTKKTICDLIYCSNLNKGGDSGGPIGTISNAGTPYNMSIMAITTGTDNRYGENNGGITYATKINNIYSRLNVVIV